MGGLVIIITFPPPVLLLIRRECGKKKKSSFLKKENRKMGLFSKDKQCRHNSMCTCGDKQTTNTETTNVLFEKALRSGRIIGGGKLEQPRRHSPRASSGAPSISRTPADVAPSPPLPLRVEDYIAYIQKHIPGTSEAAIRARVNKHLQNNPKMSVSTMLGRVRRQLNP